MPIESEDFKRLLVELVNQESDDRRTFGDWIDAQDIEAESLFELVSRIQAMVLAQIFSGETMPDEALNTGFATAFQIGWEAHRQYGEPIYREDTPGYPRE